MRNIPIVTEGELRDSLAIVSGSPRRGRLSAYGIFRNESFFAPAFLAHHRSLGVEQFVILDDRSDDGTREYLSAQPDCVVLSSTFAFGENVLAAGEERPKRAGILLKNAIPKRFLDGEWALYLDADEFLILPQGASSVREVISYLDRHGERCVVATLLDFYPPAATGLVRREAPVCLADLLADAGYFDAVPLITLSNSAPNGVAKIGEGATLRLFRTHGVGRTKLALPRPLLNALPRVVRKGLGPSPFAPALQKVPLIHWDGDIRMIGSHLTNTPPASDVLLTLAHFKFSSDLLRRARDAVGSRSYARGSTKYGDYLALLDRLGARGTLLGPNSKRYAGPQDLIDAGLMVVPADFLASLD